MFPCRQRPRSRPGDNSRARRRGGFSLVEVAVALTIAVVIAAIAIPTARGFREERKAREPVRELARLVQEMRQRSMQEDRAYQIVFDATGFHGLPFTHSYREREAFLKRARELEAGTDSDVVERAAIARQEYLRGNLQQAETLVESHPPAPAAVHKYRLPGGVACELRFWGDGDWEKIEAGKLRRWVFQPTGMVRPMRIRFQSASATFEAHFDPLTGEIQKERSYVH